MEIYPSSSVTAEKIREREAIFDQEDAEKVSEGIKEDLELYTQRLAALPSLLKQTADQLKAVDPDSHMAKNISPLVIHESVGQSRFLHRKVLKQEVTNEEAVPAWSFTVPGLYTFFYLHLDYNGRLLGFPMADADTWWPIAAKRGYQHTEIVLDLAKLNPWEVGAITTELPALAAIMAEAIASMSDIEESPDE